jgi:hypothetical protein
LGNEIKDEIILKPFPISLEFLNLGFIELIKCRLILRGSFAYAFYMHADEDEYESNAQSSPGRKLSRRMMGHGRMESRRQTFELIQSDLEVFTEMLSDVVARKRLRYIIHIDAYMCNCI